MNFRLSGTLMADTKSLVPMVPVIRREDCNMISCPSNKQCSYAAVFPSQAICLWRTLGLKH